MTSSRNDDDVTRIPSIQDHLIKLLNDLLLLCVLLTNTYCLFKVYDQLNPFVSLTVAITHLITSIKIHLTSFTTSKLLDSVFTQCKEIGIRS